MDALNILILDPDCTRRKRLISALAPRKDFRVVGEGGDIREACEAVSPPVHVHVILLNIDQPEMLASDTWATIHLLLRSARVVALTSGAKGGAAKAALAARVAGLHVVDADPAVLQRAIRNAAEGTADYDPLLIEEAICEMFCSAEPSILHLGDVAIDFAGREVVSGRRHLRLTAIESRFLRHLAENMGRPVSHADLLMAVWHIAADKGGTEDQVLSCVKRLRRKVENDPKRPVHIRTVRGKGYVLR